MFDFFYQLISGVPEPYYKYLTYTPYFVCGFFIALLLIPIFGFLARKFNIYDYPATERRKKFNLNKYDDPQRHIHDRRIPYLGGLGIFIPFLIFLCISANGNPILITVAIATTLILIGGLLDDIFNLPAIIQLGIQILAAFLIASSVINFSIITNPLGGEINLELAKIEYSIFNIAQEFVIPGDIFLMLWIGICMNAIKWVDGSDGLLGGNVFIVMLFLFIIGIRTGSPDVVVYSISLAGGVLGFLVYSFPPAKIFTGGTKTFYGFIIAVFSVLNGAKIAATMMILTLPLIDFVYVIIYRIIKYKPKNPIEVLKINDKSHLHHKLLELGFSKKQVLIIEASITLLVSSIAVLTAGTVKLFLLFFIAALTLIGILILHRLTRKKAPDAPKKGSQEPKEKSPEGKYAY